MKISATRIIENNGLMTEKKRIQFEVILNYWCKDISTEVQNGYKGIIVIMQGRNATCQKLNNYMSNRTTQLRTEKGLKEMISYQNNYLKYLFSVT